MAHEVKPDADYTLDRELAWPDDTPLLTDDFAPVNLLRDPRQSSIN